MYLLSKGTVISRIGDEDLGVGEENQELSDGGGGGEEMIQPLRVTKINLSVVALI